MLSGEPFNTILYIYRQCFDTRPLAKSGSPEDPDDVESGGPRLAKMPSNVHCYIQIILSMRKVSSGSLLHSYS